MLPPKGDNNAADGCFQMTGSSTHPASLSHELLLRDCEIQRTRGSGPGGQHRNKVETAIVITHRPTGVTGQASERRSQHKNREIAIDRLRANLAIEVRSAVNLEELPGELWSSRIRGGKVSISSSHFDFAVLLAEALDCITALAFDVPAAAQRLEVSTSQLIKFLKIEPNAFQIVNRQRKAVGLHPLK